jgi:[ribosomal protein S18]-alanine N-acetyltransferase
MSPQDMAKLHAAAFTQSRPWTDDEFASLLSSPLCFAVGDARCFALVRVIADEAELLTIATNPEHLRQGLASQCMKNWQDQAQRSGAVRAFLEVADDNATARALYAKCGFELCGTRRAYYARTPLPPVDAIVMQRLFT